MGFGIISSAQKVIPFIPDPSRATGEAVIVCPGGSYHWLSKTVEGTDVGRKLCDDGIAAFVLNYRHAGTRYLLFGPLAIPQTHYPDMLNDLRKTVKSVRENASSYGIDPDKIGVMGFSAGGHLVLNIGEDPGEMASRPDFIVSVYPVVTMSDEEIVHARSRRGLLGGKKNDPSMRDALSMEKHVPSYMPPVLLVNCVDDPTVDYRNSEVMDEALEAGGIFHRYIQYENGGHGFGASSQSAPWYGELRGWLDSIPSFRVASN
ncbi:MAG: alpha/beta hydrolase [Bacteroidales bacterium]|nr:alpha/beta hydrolase [Bacteroidales bacterium]